MDQTSCQYCEAFMVVGELGYTLGVRNLNKLSGAWVHEIDAQWKVAVNGLSRPVKVAGLELDPFEIGVWYNDWPAGIFRANGGVMAGGEAANEDTFIAAVRAAIGRAKVDQPHA